MRAFTNKDGSPKSHKNRACSICRESIQSSCLLPFRHLVPVRKYKAFMDKPILNRFMKRKNKNGRY